MTALRAPAAPGVPALTLRPLIGASPRQALAARVSAQYAVDLARVLPVSAAEAAGIAQATVEALVCDPAQLSELGQICVATNCRGLGTYWVTLDPKTAIARLQFLEVAPVWRRQGVARAALPLLHDRIAAMGGRHVELNVFAANPAAIALYRACGYEADSYQMSRAICATPASHGPANPVT